MSLIKGKDSTDFKEFRKQTEKMNRRYLQFYKDRNFDGIAAMYSKDCRFMPAGFPMQSGPKGIAAFWKMAAELGFFSLWFETLELSEIYGDHVIERCRYVFHDDKGNEMQVGKYIVIWQREENSWKYHWDIWNPDTLK